jgi:hypothetical protein
MDNSSKLTSIIDSIYANIIDSNRPSVIYMSVGCFASIATQKTDNPNRFYHQFPPALQNMYLSNEHVKFYCILIDGCLENPVYMSQDEFISNQLGLSKWKKSDDEFSYQNDRITLYPFRNNIKIKDVSHDRPRYGSEKDLDITQHLESIHDIAINQNVFFLYHDFSGVNDFQKINHRFEDTIQKNLDHIIYGLCNGDIYDCYPEIDKPHALLPFNIDYSNERPLIKCFNIKQVILNYNNTDKSMPFPMFLLNNISNAQYDNNSKLIIRDHIRFFVSRFRENLIDNILYFLRNVHDVYYNGKELYINDAHTNLFGPYIKEIYNLYDTFINRGDLLFFEKIKKIVAEKFSIEFELYNSYDDIYNGVSVDKINYISCYDIINIITQNPNKYNWSTDCYNFCKSL